MNITMLRKPRTFSALHQLAVDTPTTAVASVRLDLSGCSSLWEPLAGTA